MKQNTKTRDVKWNGLNKDADGQLEAASSQ